MRDLRSHQQIWTLQPDALPLHLLGESAPQHNFAPSQVTRGFQRYVGRRLVYAASAAVLGIALIWSGVNVMNTMRAGDEIASLRRKTQEFQQQYQQVTAQFPQAPTSTDNLRNTVEIAQQIRESMRSPEAALLLVSRALDASPGIQLGRFAWAYDRRPAPIAADAAAASVPADGSSGILLQRAYLYGEVKPFNGDFKGALQQISAFASLLASTASVAEVHALSYRSMQVRIPRSAAAPTRLAKAAAPNSNWRWYSRPAYDAQSDIQGSSAMRMPLLVLALSILLSVEPDEIHLLAARAAEVDRVAQSSARSRMPAAASSVRGTNAKLILRYLPDYQNFSRTGLSAPSAASMD